MAEKTMLRRAATIETFQVCPYCHRRVVHYGEDGTLRLRSKLILFHKSQIHATIICSGCGTPVDVDVRMGPTLLKGAKAPRLVMRRRVGVD